MGLFGKEKTSKDYLKDIAKSQKAQEKAAKQQASAAKSEARARMVEVVADSIARSRESALSEAEERKIAIEEANRHKKQLKLFYDSYEFNPNDIDDIESKALALISWLDSVDRRFKDKKTVVPLPDGDEIVIEDNNKSKEKVLTNKLAFAIERLTVLKLEPSRLLYLTDKLNSYNNRKIAKKKRTRIILLSIFTPIICAGAIVGLIFALPNAKRNGRDCKTKVLKYIQKGDLVSACDVMMNFAGFYSDDMEEYNAARDILCKELLSKKDIERAIQIERNKQDRYDCTSDEQICNYLIDLDMYDEAESFQNHKSYSELVVKHMCKKGQFNEARKFIKRQAIKADSKSEFLSTMNAIVNSYL